MHWEAWSKGSRRIPPPKRPSIEDAQKPPRAVRALRLDGSPATDLVELCPGFRFKGMNNMRAPRFSIRALLFATALVAFDCALLKSWASRGPMGLSFWVITSFSMINILAIVCYRNLARGSARKPFFLGFATFGAISLLIWLNWCLRADGQTIRALAQRHDPISENFPYLKQIEATINVGPPVIRIFKLVYLIGVTWVYILSASAIPHLVIALAGGWLARAVKRRRSGGSGRALGTPRPQHAGTD